MWVLAILNKRVGRNASGVKTSFQVIDFPTKDDLEFLKKALGVLRVCEGDWWLVSVLLRRLPFGVKWLLRDSLEYLRCSLSQVLYYISKCGAWRNAASSL